jgi:hypothetical protein
MNWIYQVLGFFVAFGPIILGTVLWHMLWSDDPGSSGGGPPGGVAHRPVPPPPTLSGDRPPRRPVPATPNRSRTHA